MSRRTAEESRKIRIKAAHREGVKDRREGKETIEEADKRVRR